MDARDNRFYREPTPLTDAKLERERIAQLEDALRWVLPMAKGYAHAHPVGRNAEIIAAAESVLSVPFENEA